MKQPCVLGVDVGGVRKGFHAVLLRPGAFTPRHFKEAGDILQWALESGAEVIAVDAPCAWSKQGKSRLAERSLRFGGKLTQCFKTPTREIAQRSDFYEWVFNGERLFRELQRQYRLYDGIRRNRRSVFETFPQAVVCALAGEVIPAKQKNMRRRQAVRKAGFNDSGLNNIDFVDAALCAITAEQFRLGRTAEFGDGEEGFIVVPRHHCSAAAP